MIRLIHLRIYRIVISVVFLILFTLLFLDQRNLLPVWIYSSVLYLQFVPSFLKFLSATTLVAAGFMVVLLLTLLFGRVYCSVLCPLGVLQDVLIRISRWFKNKKAKRNQFAFRRSFKILHYSLLAVVILLLLLDIITPLGLLDPYSIFGRFMTHLVRPVVIGVNNTFAGWLETISVYSLRPLEFRTVSYVSMGVAAGLITLVILLVVYRGREYCNTVCPVGAVLRLISRYSVFRLRINESLCNNCALCARDCKAGCIDAKNKVLDFERCIGCYNCINSCKAQGVVFVNRYAEKYQNEFSPGRRKLLAGSLLALAAGKVLAEEESEPEHDHLRGMRPENKEFPVSPPGSLSLEHFTSRCTACHLCVSVCPKQVLQPSILEYGLRGFLQPRMDYHTSYCNFDCVVCSTVCPNGAILSLTVEEKHQVQVGKAWFIRRNCVVRTERTDCGACSEHCPTKAVQMVPWRNGLLIPEVNQDICIGCGACEFACPTTPYKAIYVDGNAVHRKADLPVNDEQEQQPQKPTEDFPF